MSYKEMYEEISNFNELELFEDKLLGSGYISKVKLAQSRITGKKYAIKIVK